MFPPWMRDIVSKYTLNFPKDIEHQLVIPPDLTQELRIVYGAAFHLMYWDMAQKYLGDSRFKTLVDAANNNPVAFAGRCYKALRPCTKAKYDRLEFVDPISIRIREQLNPIAEVWNDEIYSTVEASLRVKCVPRALAVGAVLLNAGMTFRFTGYSAGVDSQTGQEYAGHMWIVGVDSRTGAAIEIDASSSLGSPIDRWKRRRDMTGLNKPSEVPASVQFGHDVATAAINKISNTIGSALNTMLQAPASPTPRTRPRRRRRAVEKSR